MTEILEATQKQIELLEKLGESIDQNKKLTRTEASKIIDEKMASKMASPKQMRKLISLGVKVPMDKTLTKRLASLLIQNEMKENEDLSQETEIER